MLLQQQPRFESSTLQKTQYKDKKECPDKQNKQKQSALPFQAWVPYNVRRTAHILLKQVPKNLVRLCLEGRAGDGAAQHGHDVLYEVLGGVVLVQVELPAEALAGAKLAREEHVPRRIHHIQRRLKHIYIIF
jgi:hypothetical protein